MESSGNLEQVLADLRELNQRIRAQTSRIRERSEHVATPQERIGPTLAPEDVRSMSRDLRAYSDALLHDSHALVLASDRILERARRARRPPRPSSR